MVMSQSWLGPLVGCHPVTYSSISLVKPSWYFQCCSVHQAAQQKAYLLCRCPSVTGPQAVVTFQVTFFLLTKLAGGNIATLLCCCLPPASNTRTQSEVHLSDHFLLNLLQDNEAADECLRAFNCKLIGQGAIINKGDICIKGLKLRRKQRPNVPQQRKHRDAAAAAAAAAAADSDFED